MGVGFIRICRSETGDLSTSYVDATTVVVQPTYGVCTACGAVEVALVQATGTRDLSGIGESAAYPTGYGCEVCS